MPDKAIVGILSGVHGAHAVKFMHQRGREEMVYCRGIIRMTIQDFLKLLDGVLEIHVVEMVKRRFD